MPTILIAETNAPDAPTHAGHLPADWAGVPLGTYAAVAATAKPGRPGVLAFAHPAGCKAVAALLGVPPDAFLSDVSNLLDIELAAPWLFYTLPEGAAAPTFTHQGITYEHVGNLEKIGAGQMEALDEFLTAHAAQPLLASPHLLAVLYKPVGQEQTPEGVSAAATAFATLPMSVAWPCLAFFLTSGARYAASISMSSVLTRKAREVVHQLQQAAGGSRPSFWNFRRWLFWTWMRHVKKLL